MFFYPNILTFLFFAVIFLVNKISDLDISPLTLREVTKSRSYSIWNIVLWTKSEQLFL